MIGRRATMSNQEKTALDKVALLRANAPYTLAGYGEFRAVIDTDGAADRRYPDLARQELKRGVALGLSVTDALAGIIVLSSLRGEGAAGEFAAMVQECVPPGDAAADAPPVTAQPGEAEANFREYFGTIPPPLAQLMRLSPRAADAYYLMRRGSIDANPLSPKYGELLLLAILAAGYSPMAARHVDGARRAGATDAEIAEATLCAIPAAGIAAWMAVGGLLEPAPEPAA
jgi:4-carboxymuconolactone decarboxylase